MSELMWRVLASSLLLLSLPLAAQAQLIPFQQVPALSPPSPDNTITLINPSNTQVANYPMQFGRPFIQGAIPHAPRVLVNGVPATSQADVKNRYPDGSVEFAVISTVIPAINENACDVTADVPADGVPYKLWSAHGNSPVFQKEQNPTNNPLYQSMDNANCAHFVGNAARTVFGTMNTLYHADASHTGSGFGFTENPPFPAADILGSLFGTNDGWGAPTYPTTLSNPGIGIGTDYEYGGGNSGVLVPYGVDINIALTYDGAIQCTYVQGQPEQNLSGPGYVLDICSPPPPAAGPPIITMQNYNWGADGDHGPTYEGKMIGFDQIWMRTVLPLTTIHAINDAKAAYYATPGSASPVECSIAGATCDMALSVTHKLVAGATTAFRLWNATTHAFQDIGFDGSGNVDTAAALSFCGTVANCNYVTIYDQAAEVRSGPQTVTLTFQDTTATSTPMTLAAMKAMLPVGQAAMTLTPGGTVDAGQMLIDGKCQPWTQGAVAQTMICGDDTATRSYDLGTGDGYHPFRPHFYATFWPSTSQVFIRATGENDLTTEPEDLRYTFTMTDGYAADLSGTQPINPKLHWLNTRWSHTFWLGGTPSNQVNIDEGLAYLDSTRFLPNLDPSVATMDPTTMTTNYGNWLKTPHDIYDAVWDGANGLYGWTNAMGTPGDSYHLGPFPLVTVSWLHNADWRMRQMALNETDLAAAWPLNWRESDPTRAFRRGGSAVEGLGRTLSASGRPSLDNGYHTADDIHLVGAAASGPWTADGDHQPSVYFPAYVLTGDPWYLDMLYFWAGDTVFIDNPAPAYVCTNQTTDCSHYRGPTGAYGGIHQSCAPRGFAWVLRGRAETAFAAPDGTPEKSYFTYMTNDLIAKWEGSLNITSTPFSTATVYTWVKSTSVPYECGAPQGVVPPLGNLESICYPNVCGYDSATQLATGWVPGVNGSFADPWMNFYMQYALGRSAELGFQVIPLMQQYDAEPIGMINDSGFPYLLADYEMPVTRLNGPYWTTWAAVIAAQDPTYLANLQTYWVGGMQGGRQTWVQMGLAEAVDQGISGAAAAWAWYNTNGYSLPGAASWRAQDPRWAVIPRLDTNVLPAQTTVTPP